MSKNEPLARYCRRDPPAVDIQSLTQQLREHPDLASARLLDAKGSSGTPVPQPPIGQNSSPRPHSLYFGDEDGPMIECGSELAGAPTINRWG